MSNINEFTQFFPNPAISVFNRSAMKDFDLRIGPMYPSYWDIVNFGNSAKGSSGHKMRLAPLLAPTFSNLQLQEHTAIVPLRTIMSDYEDKFNYALHPEGASLPNISMTNLLNIYKAMNKLGLPIIGSLFDFLGYPVFGDLYKVVNSEVNNFGFMITRDSADVRESPFYIPSTNEWKSPYLTSASFVYRDQTLSLSSSTQLYSFVGWLLNSEGYDTTYEGLVNFYRVALSIPRSSRPLPDQGFQPSLDDLILASSFETVDSAVNSYISYLFLYFLNDYLLDSVFPENFYSALPLRAYWRFCYDFLQNGNYTDVINLSQVYTVEEVLYLSAQWILMDDASDADRKNIRFYSQPLNRLWDDDFFTSLLPSSKVDNAVEIPANSTVLDLAKLSAFQRFVMKLSYSSRYRDTVWNIFKVKPSDARLQQSSLISHRYHDVGIGETLQTSETSVSSVLGSFAGRGYSSGRSNGYHIFCEEPCVLLSFVSLIPKASYADALHPLIHVTDTLDFPLPDMDVLGNQPIYSDLVSGNPVDSDTIIGYGRQYQEWLSNYNTVHGNFKTSLDYWQLTRRFNDTPVINDDFLRINDADDFDKIFSVPNAPHAFLSIFYNCKISRPVHRNVRILI